MIPHRDEILQSAVSNDSTAVPRYNLVRPDGTVVERNVALKLANAIAQNGTPINKALLDELLAASGVTAGSTTAYSLAQEGYELFDGAPIRFRLHAASGDGATLNVAGTGAKPLVDMMGKAMPGGIPAGTWLTAYYSAAAGAYVLAGGEAVRALYGERYTVDDAVAHVKDVPGDALPYAEVGEVGGMTYRVNVGTEAAPVYELRSAAVSEIESVGVNLFDFETWKEDLTVSRGTYISDDNSITFSATGSDAYIVNMNYGIPVIGGESYTIAIDKNIEITSECYLFKNGKQSSFLYFSGNKYTFVAENDAEFYSLRIGVLQVGQIQTFSNIRVNKGEAALPYAPYQHHVLPISEAVQALDGYGWGVNETVYNYIDWKNRKFVKMVERVDMGTRSWEYVADRFNGSFRIYISSMKSTTAASVCSRYQSVDSDLASYDKAVYTKNNGNAVYVKDSAYTDTATFKAAMAGVMLYYELATPIITDISDILPADNILPVEAGGTITAVNEHNYAVPSTITYQRNVLDNRASTYAVEKLRLALELLASIDDVDAAIAAAIKPLATSAAVTSAIAAAVAPLAKSDLSNASGTFKGAVKANASAVAALGTAQVRNVTISATDLTAGSSALATGDSYRVYS